MTDVVISLGLPPFTCDAECFQTQGEYEVLLDDIVDKMENDKKDSGDDIIKVEIPQMKELRIGSIMRGMVSVDRMVTVHPGDAPWVSSTSLVHIHWALFFSWRGAAHCCLVSWRTKAQEDVPTCNAPQHTHANLHCRGKRNCRRTASD